MGLDISLVFFFILGVVMGSFYNVVIYRVPQGKSFAYPSSSCPSCGRRLRPFELIPVISYVVQRGRCKGCKCKISWQYPVVELLAGLGFAYLGWHAATWGQLATELTLFSLLLVLGFIDGRHMLLPDLFTIPGMILGFLFAVMGWSIPWLDSLLGLALGCVVALVMSLIFRGGMGMGDMKLLAMIGSFLGPWHTLLTLFWASVLGSVFGIVFLYVTKRDHKTPIPFGPFLALGAFIIMLWLG